MCVARHLVRDTAWLSRFLKPCCVRCRANKRGARRRPHRMGWGRSVECILEGACRDESRAAGASARRRSVSASASATTTRPTLPLELEDILTAIRETAYRWDFASDRIDWAPNAQTVLGVADPEMIGKGRAFALLVDPEHAGPRYDGITGGPHLPPGTELRYCLRYRFLPEGRRGRAAVWVEDTGVCAIDAECAAALGARHAQAHRQSPPRRGRAAALSRQSRRAHRPAQSHQADRGARPASSAARDASPPRAPSCLPASTISP